MASAAIDHGLREYQGHYVVVRLPNITNIFYDRDVGYAVERIDLDAAVQDISATKVRNAMNSGGR